MRQQVRSTRRKRKARRRLDEAESEQATGRPADMRRPGREQDSRPGPFYAAGPVFSLHPGGKAVQGPTTEPLPDLAGQGAPSRAVAFNQRGPLRLQGRTEATYDGGRFHTENVTVLPASACQGCRGQHCIRATGTLVATYSVQTRVTLPSVNDYPGLASCQQRGVQDAIDN